MQTPRPPQTSLTIDIDFHIGTDTPPGKDPDTYSPTVARYHVALWSKALPNGVLFDLEAPDRPPFYLHHRSDLGEFWLSSDQAVHTYTRWGVMQAIIEQLPEEGGVPGDRVDDWCAGGLARGAAQSATDDQRG